MAIADLFFSDSSSGDLYDVIFGLEIVAVGDRTFVYTSSIADDRIIISELFADGSLIERDTVESVNGDGLNEVAGFATTQVGGTTYLYANGQSSDAVTVFEVGADGGLTSLQTIFDSSDALLELNGPFGEMTIATSGGNTFLVVHAFVDDGLSVFQIGADGLLTSVDNVTDADLPAYELNGAANTTFVEYMGTSFVIASGQDDNGVTIFSLSSTGQLTFLSAIADTGGLELSGARGVETAIIDGTLFLYVGGRTDDGISVFTLDAAGIATNVFNYQDTPELALNGVRELDMFEFQGTTYLMTGADTDDGISIFEVQSDGSLVLTTSVFDSDDPALLLDATAELEFVEIDGQGLVLSTSPGEDAVSVFVLDPENLTTTGTPDDDVLIGDGRDNVINAEEGDDVVLGNEGADTIDGGQGNDLLVGGTGEDRLDGDGNLTQTASDVETVTETGQDLALSITLPDSSDGSSIEISGVVSRSPNLGSDYNIVYVIDVSPSMEELFSGNETIGDLNGDGLSNTLLDGTIAAFQSLNDSLIAGGFASSDVAVVAFAGSANTIYNGSALGGVNEALEGLSTAGSTDFEDALQETIVTLQGMGDGQNVVYFISDGEPNGGPYIDEVGVLIDPAGLNASISAFGVGLNADIDQLDFVDDATDNDSALLVLEPSTLTGGLTGSPVDAGEVDRLEIYVNGVLVETVDGVDFVSTPLGLQYNAELTGLSTTSGDVIDARLIATDTAETEVNVSLTVPNELLVVGDDTLIGGAGDDTLDGDGGNDTLLGELGSDLLIAGTGHDLLDGGNGGDRLFGGLGDDTLIGGSGADLLTGGIGDDSYYVDTRDFVDETGGAASDFDTIVTRISTDLTNLGDDFIGSFEAIRLIGMIDANARGDSNDNALTGNRADNLLVGRDGDDTLSGRAGDDVMSGGDGEDDMRGEDGNDTMYGNNDDDTLRGHAGDDVLFGGSGMDSLSGGDGNDDLEGGSNADILVGGDGQDTLNGGGNADTMYGNDGDDTLIGETGADSMSGGNDNDVLVGRDQNDTLRGGNGEDVLYGGADQDLLSGNDGDDELNGGSDDDRLFGGNGADTLNGDSGADELSGGNDNDSLDGGSNNDTLSGGAGDDTVTGDTGNDDIQGDAGDDLLLGRDGADTMRGGDDNDTLFGGQSDDLLVGNDGNDAINGGSNDDRLFGGNGADTLEGDSGADTLSGGSGADVFVFADPADSPHVGGRDTISDFTSGEDMIDLSGLGTLTFVSSYTGAGNEVRYNATIGRLYVDLDGDNISDVSVDLTGAPTLDVSDLIL